MSDQPFDHTQVDELRRSMRELVGLSSLPAVWVANDPPAMAAGLARVLCRCLPASFAYVRLIGEDGTTVTEVIESDRGTERGRAESLGETLKPFIGAGEATIRDVPNPLGEGVLRLAITKIGHDGEYGTVVTGSDRTPFPTPIDRLLLGVAINQAAIILQQKRSQAQLRRSERELADFFDNASVGLHWVGPDGTILRVNRAELSLLGYTEDEYVGRHISTFHADAEVIDEILRRLHAGERLRDHPARMLAKDGSIKHVMIDSSVMWDDGKFVHTRCFTRDVTDQRLAEGERQRHGERLRLLWETAAVLLGADNADAMLRDLVATIGPHLGVDSYFHYAVNANDGTLELTSSAGIERDAISPLIRKSDDSIISVVVERRQPVTIDAGRADADAGRWLKACGVNALTCQPLLAADRLIGVLAFGSRTTDHFDADEQSFIQTVCHYVTLAYERLHLLSELKEGDRRKDEFLATLAHELRNPLAPMRNAIQLLKLKGPDEPQLRWARDVIERQLQYLKRLIEDLMDVSRITRNKLELRRERVALNDIVQGAVESSRPIIEQNELQLTVSLPPQPVFLDGDAVRLAQVLLNLLNNAAKYTDRGGQISLSAHVEGEEVVVSVKDTGIGIAPEKRARLFELFFQVDRTLERSQGGLGIGLALVRRLVELHGGCVEFRSDGVGMGSEFTLRLPNASESSLAVSAPARSPATVSPVRLLVADDNRDSADSLAMLLRVHGHDVHTAYDGVDAVNTADRLRPDAVLLDIGMPRLNGYDACRQIRQSAWGRDVLLIAMTGWGQANDRRRTVDVGFDAHLVKPVDPQELIALLATRQPGSAMERTKS